MDKLVIGIAAYGQQSMNWWYPLATMTASLYKYDIELLGIVTAGSMNTDANRNKIADKFLAQKDADWILWMDTDNVIPLGGIRRLMDTQKKIVSGLYYLKAEPYVPVAYQRLLNGMYHPIQVWNRGELLPVASIGMGAALIHRSVYEDIKENYTVFQRWTGGLTTIHKDDMSGVLKETFPTNPKPVVKGSQYREWIIKPDYDIPHFPFYMLEFGRTEDMWFYETAIRCGHQPYVDTSVECIHIGEHHVDGEFHRKFMKDREAERKVVATEYTDTELGEP